MKAVLKRRVLRVEYNEVGAFSGVFREGVRVGVLGWSALAPQVWQKGGSILDKIFLSCHLNPSPAQQRQMNVEKVYFLPASGSWSIL